MKLFQNHFISHVTTA